MHQLWKTLKSASWEDWDDGAPVVGLLAGLPAQAGQGGEGQDEHLGSNHQR